MAIEAARELLRACPQLAGLDPASVDTLAAASVLRSYRAGATLFHAGGPGDAMFVLRRGAVVSRARSSTGDVTDLGVAAEGDAFGYMEILVPGPRTEDAVALRGSTVLVVPGAVTYRVLRSSPDTLLCLLGDLVRIVRIHGRARAGQARPVTHRLASLLLEQPDRGGRVTFDGPQAHLAQRLGIARQTLNTALRDLDARGLLTVHPGGRAVTLDRAALTDFVAGAGRTGGALVRKD